jgi:GNAT superfamily N-acetyltransferase
MDPIKESVGLLVDTWKMLVERFPTGTVSHSDGVSAALGNVPLPFLNMCTHDSPIEDDEDLRRRLGLVLERTAQCSHPWLFALCEPWAPGNWQPVAEEAGLEPALRLTGMATDRLKPPRRPLSELEYRRVNDEATARDIAEINMQAYEMSPEMVECICNLRLWTEETHGYVGYLDGKRVTCSATFPVNGTVYVAFVATLPDAYGKGYAEAVMRHSIEQGGKAMGSSRTTLHASETGHKLYEAMSYRSHCKFSVLAKPH